jgi:hypothetical protein
LRAERQTRLVRAGSMADEKRQARRTPRGRLLAPRHFRLRALACQAERGDRKYLCSRFLCARENNLFGALVFMHAPSVSRWPYCAVTSRGVLSRKGRTGLRVLKMYFGIKTFLWRRALRRHACVTRYHLRMPFTMLLTLLVSVLNICSAGAAWICAGAVFSVVLHAG